MAPLKVFCPVEKFTEVVIMLEGVGEPNMLEICDIGGDVACNGVDAVIATVDDNVAGEICGTGGMPKSPLVLPR